MAENPPIELFGLHEDELNEIVEYFDVYRMDPLPPGLCKEDLPVSVSSFGVLLEDMGFVITESELHQLVRKLDPHVKGYIVLSTFLEHGAKPLMDRSKVTEENAREIFELLDMDEDTMISAYDLQQVLKMFGEESTDYTLRSIIREADLDGDDLISFDEFLYFTTGLVR